MTTFDELAQRNRAAGGHWFDRGALRFFRSRVLEGTYPAGAVTFFVSSERFSDDVKRAYSVRYMTADGMVETFGGFQGYGSARAARRAAERAAHLLSVVVTR